MLRTNLSTRPFYNTRTVLVVLVGLALVAAAFTLFNVFRVMALTQAESSLGSRAVQAEQEAERLRTDAAAIRARTNPRELATVAGAAREANGIIDRRTFSWSDLFAQFEQTLPDDVRITSVQPRLDRSGAFVLVIGVEARRIEELDAFVEALDSTGTFRNVLSVRETTDDDNLIQASIEAIYLAQGRDAVAASSASPATSSGGAASAAPATPAPPASANAADGGAAR